MRGALPALALLALLAGPARAGAGPQPPRGAPRCRVPPPACQYVGGSKTEHQYTVHNQSILIISVAGVSLTVRCGGAAVLEAAALAALPAHAEPLAVPRVTLDGCVLPRAAPLAAAVRALGAALLLAAEPGAALALTALPPAPPLRADHLAGLERLAALTVAASGAAPARPAPGFLAPLRELASLSLLHAALPPGELDAPPAALRRLVLRHAGVRRVPRAWPVTELTVESATELDAEELPAAVRDLDLRSRSTRLRLDAAPVAEHLAVAGWSERAPPPLTRCPALRSLTLTAPALEALPAGWLARCVRLEALALHGATRLLALPPRLLAGAAALAALSLRQGALEELPVEAGSGAGLLDSSPALRTLNLAGNRLRKLPSGTFAVASGLRKLDLSSNSLDDSVLGTLAPLTALEELSLAYNPRIESACSSPLDRSPLHGAAGLRELSVRGTGVSVVCSDWRRDMLLLQRLDLRDTNISELWYADVQFERSVRGARVLLQGAPVAVLAANASDYELATRAAPPARLRAAVELDESRALACDCRMYWTRRALPALAHVRGMRCAAPAAPDTPAGTRPLRLVPPEDMACAAAGECAAFPALPAACACDARPAADPGAGELLVRLRCERAGLRAVPRPRAPPAARRPRRRYELLLAHNDIAELHADDLTDDVEALDLRHNRLGNVTAAAAARLGRVRGALRLAGNPLDCSCRAAPLLRALRARPPAELAALTCGAAGAGGPLAEAPAAECAPPEPRGARFAAALAVGLAALLALALAALAALASRERRFSLKAVLHRWGLLWRAAEPAEDVARPYDAFVTFAHEDAAAALELVARLEPPYRLCVHYRDWAPGRLIADHIAESVERSRRTVALVSRHFLSSAWARAEFRSAHGAALRDSAHRLVVVLLEEPAELPLDARLQRYLATNTYVRWSDPWLWDKLRVALPPPRAPVPPATSAPAAPRATPPPAVPSTTTPAPVPSTTASPAVPSVTAPAAVPSTTASLAVPSATTPPAVPSANTPPAVPSATTPPAVPSATAPPAVPSATPSPVVPSATKKTSPDVRLSISSEDSNSSCGMSEEEEEEEEMRVSGRGRGCPAPAPPPPRHFAIAIAT